MYKVKFGGKNGKTINLVESPDMVAIRTKRNQELENVSISRESKELLDQTTEVAKFPEAGVTVRRVAVSGELESTQSTVDLRDETRAALKQEDNIRFAGRVLQDAESGRSRRGSLFQRLRQYNSTTRRATTPKPVLPYASCAACAPKATGSPEAPIHII